MEVGDYVVWKYWGIPGERAIYQIMHLRKFRAYIIEIQGNRKIGNQLSIRIPELEVI